MLNLILILLILSTCHSYSQSIYNEEGTSSEKCLTQIIVENQNPNLGSFFNGTRNNPVPGFGGNSNYLRYYIYGYDKDEFQLNIELTDNIKYGDDFITIDEWEVVIDDEFNNSSQRMFKNDKFNQKIIRNKKSKEKKCNGLTTVTIYIHKITVGSNVQSGTINFNLFLSITALY